MLIQAPVGPQITGDTSAPANARLGRLGELVVQELHGRFYEQCYRGNLYSGSASGITINNATFTTATVGATATPIAGVWNPASSPVNLVILQAALSGAITALTATGPGALFWNGSLGNSSITTGTKGFNRKTFLNSGGYGVNVSNFALTGLTTNLVAVTGSAISIGTAAFSQVGIATGFPTLMAGSAYDNFDGSIIVPPGGVLGLFATTTPVAHTVSSFISWEEVAL
jgi:hypothetical protein